MTASVVSLLLLSFLCACATVKGDDNRLVSVPKTCEDVLSADRCARLRNIAVAVKAKASEVELAVRLAVANGTAKAQDIYAKAIDFFRNRVQTLTCSDLLTPARCEHLRNITIVIRAKSSQVNEAVRAAVLRGYEASKDVYAKAVDFFATRLQSLNCPALIPVEYCSRLSVVAINLKGKMAEAEEKIRAALLAGKTRAVEMYGEAVEFLKNQAAANRTCEEILSVEKCTQLRSLTTSLKLKASEIKGRVIDLLSDGVTTTVTAFETVKQYLTAKVTCEAILSNTTCSKLRRVASLVSVSIVKVDNIIRNAVVKGVSKLTDLYRKVMDFLKGKIFGRSRRALFPGLKARIAKAIQLAKERLAKAIDKYMNELKIVDMTVRAIVKQAILDGKVRLLGIKAAIKAMLDNLVGGGASNAVATKQRRDAAADDLQQVLAKVHGALKSLMDKVLANLNAALSGVRSFIVDTMRKINGGVARRDIADDFDSLQSLVSLYAKEELQSLADEAEAQAEGLLSDVIEESERNIDDATASFQHDIQRRGVETDDEVNKINLEFILGAVGSLFGNEARATLQKLVDANHAEIEAALKRGGAAMISVLQGLLQ